MVSEILPMDKSFGDVRPFLGRNGNKNVDIPLEYRRRTHQTERQTNYWAWKLSTGCDVIAYGDKNSNVITRFEVFGASGRVERAVSEIKEWMRVVHTKSSASTAWSKVKAYDPNKFGYEFMREMEVQRKAIFKGPMPEDMSKLVKTTVDWPEDLATANVFPKDVFGTDLSKIDPIRTADEVFIIPVSGGQKFDILGLKEKNVSSAEQHFINTVRKVRLNKFGATEPIHVILDEHKGMEVQLTAAEEWWPNRNTHRIVPRLISSPMRNIQLALEAARYEKAHYEFCIRFGCLALRYHERHVPDSLIGKTFNKAAFLKGVNGLISCEAKKWAMYNEDGDDLLDRMITAHHLFEPTKSADYYGHTPDNLEEIRPIFRGTWVFVDPNARQPAQSQTQAGGSNAVPPLIVARIDWTDDEEGMYEKGQPQYYHIPPGQSGPKEHMDLKLLELADGKAWQFSLESMIPASRKLVSPAIERFAQGVTMKKNYDISSNEPFASTARDKIDSLLKLQHRRLDKIYSFGIRETSYKVELVCMWYFDRKTPSWGLNLRHKAWIDHLSELETLRPGDAARWGEVVSTFLPDDGEMPLPAAENGSSALDEDVLVKEIPPRAGLSLLIRKLMEVSEVINDTGGVSVG